MKSVVNHCQSASSVDEGSETKLDAEAETTVGIGIASRARQTATAPRADSGLTRDECLQLLGTASMGRVALSIGALPVVLPVGFALLDEDVVFRSLIDEKLSAPGVDVVLAFQVDHFGAVTESGWSVLVQGLASEVVEKEELERCQALRLPARGGVHGHPHFARIATTRLTGRRFAAA
jgi:uncharacterized protein